MVPSQIREAGKPSWQGLTDCLSHPYAKGFKCIIPSGPAAEDRRPVELSEPSVNFPPSLPPPPPAPHSNPPLPYCCKRQTQGVTQVIISVQCCFTSTETMRLITDGEPRTAFTFTFTFTFTQLLSSVSSASHLQAKGLYKVNLPPPHTHTPIHPPTHTHTLTHTHTHTLSTPLHTVTEDKARELPKLPVS